VTGHGIAVVYVTAAVFRNRRYEESNLYH
jgi:hypothetical protein